MILQKKRDIDTLQVSIFPDGKRKRFETTVTFTPVHVMNFGGLRPTRMREHIGTPFSLFKTNIYCFTLKDDKSK